MAASRTRPSEISSAGISHAVSTPAGAGSNTMKGDAASMLMRTMRPSFTSAASRSPVPVSYQTKGSTSTQSRAPALRPSNDRQIVVQGKSVSVRVDRGGRRIIKKKNNKTVQYSAIKYLDSNTDEINNNN